jgi:hypothetical protein
LGCVQSNKSYVPHASNYEHEHTARRATPRVNILNQFSQMQPHWQKKEANAFIGQCAVLKRASCHCDGTKRYVQHGMGQANWMISLTEHGMNGL